MSGETSPTHHFCPPLTTGNAPTAIPVLEDRVAHGFMRGLPGCTITRGYLSRGEYVLVIRIDRPTAHLHHEVRDRTLIGALAQVQRFYDSFTDQEAA